MNKKFIALAVAAAFALPLSAQADDAVLSGFANIEYNNYDDGNAKGNQNFGAEAEIDAIKTFGSVTVRVDVDLNLAMNSTPATGPLANGNSSAAVEQALFAWAASDAITVIGGVFNNPIGQEAEDKPDILFTSYSAIYNILDHQTALNGNNIAGVAVAGNLGPVTLTAAALNDIGQSAGENSFAIVANASPIEGLDLEFGYVTQQDFTSGTSAIVVVPNTTTSAQAGNVWNVNGSFNIDQFTIGADVLGAQDIIDLAYNVWASFDATDAIALRARYESVKYDASLGTDNKANKFTVYGGYAIADNLIVALEYSKGTGSNTTLDRAVTGIINDSSTTAQFIATF